MTPQTERRIQRIIANSIGKTLRVRLNVNTCVRGEVLSSRFVGWLSKGEMQRTVVFEVKMACGVTKVEKTFTVSRLPDGKVPYVTVLQVRAYDKV